MPGSHARESSQNRCCDCHCVGRRISVLPGAREDFRVRHVLASENGRVDHRARRGPARRPIFGDGERERVARLGMAVSGRHLRPVFMGRIPRTGGGQSHRRIPGRVGGVSYVSAQRGGSIAGGGRNDGGVRGLACAARCSTGCRDAVVRGPDDCPAGDRASG